MTAKVINADLAISAKIISIWRGAGPFASTWVIGREKERCSIRKAHPVQSLVVGAMQRFWLIVTKGKSWQRKVIQKSCCKIGHQLHCGQCQVWQYDYVGTVNVHDIECSVGSLLLWITYWLGKKSPKFLLRKKKRKENAFSPFLLQDWYVNGLKWTLWSVVETPAVRKQGEGHCKM